MCGEFTGITIQYTNWNSANREKRGRIQSNIPQMCVLGIGGEKKMNHDYTIALTSS
jgi:hypothetical protein